MAVALSPSSFGRLLDPLGGQRDLGRRRLRPLSPLSFVEDPTRIFRAARYVDYYHFEYDFAPDPAASAENGYRFLRRIRF